MSWLFPTFLAGTFVLGLPILLHLLRSRPKTVHRFPTLRFLGASAIRDTKKHRLRRRLTLLLRCLIIALLAAAFARPFFADLKAARGRVMIVAIDNSMSMQAADRWDTQRKVALQHLRALGRGDRAGLLRINPTPGWIVPLTEDLAGVIAALDAARPGWEGTRYSDALRFAGEALAAQPGRRKTLVWTADEQLTGWAGTDFAIPLPDGIELVLAPPAPAPKRQSTIAGVRWMPDGQSLKVDVRTLDPAADRRILTVSAAGEVLARQEVALQRGTDTSIVVPLKTGRAGLEGVRVELDPDDLSADDTAWIAAAPANAIVALLDPASGTDFIAHALKAAAAVGAGAISPQPLPDAEWAPDSVPILRGAAAFLPPHSGRLQRFLETGGALWIFTDGSPEQTKWLKTQGIALEAVRTGQPLRLRDWDGDHPALEAFAGDSLLPLLDVAFHGGFALKGEALSPIANWPDGSTAIAEWSAGGRRAIIAGFAPTREATDWPVHPSFLPFTHEAARWLASTASRRGDFRVGDTIPLPAESGTWKLLDPPGDAVQAGGSIRPDAPGLYTFDAGETRHVFAVNTPAGESDLSPWPDTEQLASLQSPRANAPATARHLPGVRVSDEVAESQQRIWWWLLAFCGLALLGEIALANRTAL